MDEAIAYIKDEFRTSDLRLTETTSACRQRSELAGQLKGNLSPLQQQPHQAARAQPTQPIPGQPLTTLKYRPAEEFKASARHWNPEVENPWPIGYQQMTACTVNDLLECGVLSQQRQAGGKCRQRWLNSCLGHHRQTDC